MQVEVIDNTGEIKRTFAVKANLFLRAVADEIVREAEPNTPMSAGYAKGNLRRNILKQVLGLTGKITWGMNYAIYQEKKQFKKYTTAGTGPHFAENAVRATYDRANSIAKRVGLI